jgi:drug/metabolite transporter (DMT)-like permease
MGMGTSRADWLIFLALGLSWGSSYMFIKIAVDDFGTFTLVALRLAVGAALLWTVVRVAGKQLPTSVRTYGHLVVIGAVNIAIPFALITWSERSVDSELAAILTGIAPLVAGVLAPIFIPDEPLRANSVLGLAIGFVGVIVLTGGGGGTPTDVAGALALVAAAVCYGAGAVYARRNVHGLDPMIPAVFQVTFALAMTGVIAMGLERPWDARPGMDGVFAIVWLGLLGTGLAYLAVFRLLKHWGATRTTAVAYVIPVVGIVLGAVFLSEPVDAHIVVGTGLVIAGIALVSGRWGRRVLFSRGAAAATGMPAGTPGK